jgi:hypothetical protein
MATTNFLFRHVPDPEHDISFVYPLTGFRHPPQSTVTPLYFAHPSFHDPVCHHFNLPPSRGPPKHAPAITIFEFQANFIKRCCTSVLSRTASYKCLVSRLHDISPASPTKRTFVSLGHICANLQNPKTPGVPSHLRHLFTFPRCMVCYKEEGHFPRNLVPRIAACSQAT